MLTHANIRMNEIDDMIDAALGQSRCYDCSKREVCDGSRYFLS